MSHPLEPKLLTPILWAIVFIIPLASLSVTVFGVTKSSKTVIQNVAKPKSKTVSKTTAKTVAKCDPNYSGCVPIASDVDCKPGNGNGPAYQYTTVKVLKKDIYKLDSDKDGWACER